MQSIAEFVFSIPELLEYILLFVPPEDVLLVQRVSQAFRCTTANSRALQEILFFRAAPFERSRSDIDKQVGCHLNPWLERRFPPWFNAERLPMRGLCGKKSFDGLHWNLNDWTFQAYAREDASWRRMLVAQPPITTLEVWIIAIRATEERIRRGELRFSSDKGLRMGTLYDLCEAHLIADAEDGGCVATGGEFAVDWRSDGFSNYILNLPGTDEGTAEIRETVTRDTQKIALVLSEIEADSRDTPEEWGAHFRSEGRARQRVEFREVNPDGPRRFVGHHLMPNTDPSVPSLVLDIAGWRVRQDSLRMERLLEQSRERLRLLREEQRRKCVPTGRASAASVDSCPSPASLLVSSPSALFPQLRTTELQRPW